MSTAKKPLDIPSGSFLYLVTPLQSYLPQIELSFYIPTAFLSVLLRTKSNQEYASFMDF